ncbi:MAG: FAD-dependent monooxygenase [Hyphomicrobiaceae bacterium]
MLDTVARRRSEAGISRPPIAVVGTGLAGLSTALALAELGVETVLVGPRPTAARASLDTRSTALFGPSIDLLDRLGVLPRLEPPPVPLAGLRLVDATGSVFRAPEVLFEAKELGVPAFGMNIENHALLAALSGRTRASPRVVWHEASAVSVGAGGETASVELADGTRLETALVVGADGERSLCRKAAGIGDRSRQYPQAAIAGRFRHQRPHAAVSTELHRRAGPLTTVPLAGDWSSLVWVEKPDVVDGLLGLDDRAFARKLEEALAGILGRVLSVSPRASFPLSVVTADRLGDHRIALVGEAAHRLPPIGAQGLNLGLRDAAWLAELVADAVTAGGDPGSQDVLDAYDRIRRSDVVSRTAAVDALNWSLVADWLPADFARGAGLAALKAIGPLRRLIMREGMSPSGALPRLMQPRVSAEDGSKARA